MADPRFPIKQGSNFSQALSISLGWRVLLLSIALLVIPLILYGLLMFRHVAEIKQQEAFLELALFVEDKKNAVEEKIFDAERSLRVARSMVLQGMDPSDLSDLFKEMVIGVPGEMLLLSQKTSNIGWVNVASSEKALVQMKPPCEEAIGTGSEKLSACQWQDRQLLVFTESISETCRLLFFWPLQEIIYPPSRKLSSSEQIKIHLFCDGKIVGASPSLFSPQKVLVVPYDRLFRVASGKEEIQVPSGVSRIATRLPIRGSSFELFIDLPFQVDSVDHRFWRPLSSIIVLIIVLGGGIVWWLTHKMAKPLKTLARVMQKVESGVYDVRYIPEPFGFEVNGLGTCFNHMLTTMLANIEESAKHKIAKQLLSKELAIGHDIQKRLFPRSLPSLPHLDIATMFHPAQAVAGDFYDLFPSRGKLLIVMADAAGKGVSACLYAFLLRGMLRSLQESGKTLAEIVSIAQKLLVIDAGESSMFITAWIGLLDPETLQLQYASLGHFPALLRRQGKVEELDVEGSALGIEPMKQPAIGTMKLEQNDLLFLYTDGLVESRGNDRKGIKDKVKNLDANLSSSQVLERLVPPPPYEDDITLVAIRIT